MQIEVINRQRLHRLDRAAIAALARQTLDRIGQTQATATITFIRDPEMRRLNRDFRNLDKPTDVLSFPGQETAGEFPPLIVQDPELPPGVSSLGDVIISVETAGRYALKLGLPLEREIRNLVIHGMLHLAGYDHETDNGEMNRLERRLRKALN
ncbi:MAG: rRNA maturation RNase YbeY [Blastocatellia bacterium]